MKFTLLLVTLLLFASPVVALPTRISCSESDGIIIKESNEVMDSFGSTSAKIPICKSDEYSLDCSGEAALYGEDSPCTIEFNLDTQEAVVNRDYETRFYTVEATEDQIRLIRKRRPLDESTYQSTGSQIFIVTVLSLAGTPCLPFIQKSLIQPIGVTRMMVIFYTLRSSMVPAKITLLRNCLKLCSSPDAKFIAIKNGLPSLRVQINQHNLRRLI